MRNHKTGENKTVVGPTQYLKTQKLKVNRQSNSLKIEIPLKVLEIPYGIRTKSRTQFDHRYLRLGYG